MRALLFAALAIAPVATAQPIATDRPDFTESTEVVPLRRVQVEAGTTAEWADDQSALSGPELLVRWAPFSRIEMRLEAPDYSTAGDGGFGDAAVGAKVQLGPRYGLGFAVIGMVTILVGDTARSAGGLDPSLTATLSRDLAPGVGLGLQGAAAWISGEERVDLMLTLVAGADLSEHVGAFVELAAADIAGDPGLILHHGYTLSLSPNAQFDAHAGVGLAGGAPDAFVGLGFAIRR